MLEWLNHDDPPTTNYADFESAFAIYGDQLFTPGSATYAAAKELIQLSKTERFPVVVQG